MTSSWLGARASEVALRLWRRASHIQRDVVTLHTGFEGELDVRFDLGRVGEVDGAAAHSIALPTKKDLAPFLQREATCEHRAGQRADDLEIAAEPQPTVVVVDDDVLR